MSDQIARIPLRMVIDEPGEPVLRRTIVVVAALMRTLTHIDWRQREKVPARGGVVFVVNHISNFDPLAYGHFLAWAGRWPRFLAKAEIFRVPGLGWIARHSGQIEVRRGGPEAAQSVEAAIAAVRAGRAVTIYPEGTITADPLTWPMTGRTGAARVALGARCPVIPIGQWGAQEVLPGKKLTWPRLFPRKTMRVIAGDPVDLADLYDRPLDEDVLAEATERILEAITDLVAQLRRESPPPGRWDPVAGRRLRRGTAV
jgi:1-acyl-sn-glycerol-3-phosphate acyltransferase